MSDDCPVCGRPVERVLDIEYGPDDAQIDGDACVSAGITQPDSGTEPTLTVYVHDGEAEYVEWKDLADT